MVNNEPLEKTKRNAIVIKVDGNEADVAIANIDTNSINAFSHDGPFAFSTAVCFKNINADEARKPKTKPPGKTEGLENSTIRNRLFQ